MKTNWNDRPVILANILNPAFCGEVLRIASESYYNETGKHLPFALYFIILPLILHKPTRDALPKTTSTKFYEWLKNNPILRINIQNRIKNMVPFTREAIQFLIYYEVISITTDGNFIFNKSKKKSVQYVSDSEIKDIYDKTKMMGKWISKMGNEKTIYATLGIRP